MTIVEELKQLVGPGRWITDSHALAPHLTEWRDTWHGNTPIMVSPDSVEMVADVVRACQRRGTPIVPQGGNTGLCGGAIPNADGSQVLLSMSRMNRVRQVSPDDHSMVVEAGCTLLEVQQAALEAGRFFPLSLAAEGTCQIGGNLSTNAGGINVLRYGTARDQVLGLEVVLANGDIWHGLRSLRKDTAGYDLKQLFIGSEGTLGIITAACVKVYPQARNSCTAFIAVPDPAHAIDLLSQLRADLADQIQAFELIPDRAIRFVARHVPSAALTLEPVTPWYVLLEATNVQQEALENLLMAALEKGRIADAIVAKNDSEANGFWAFRHAISESQKKEGASLKHDVSVPVGSVADFIAAATKASLEFQPGTRVVPFGHVGDGNIHFNLSQPVDMAGDAFLDLREAFAGVIYDIVHRFSGSISAEHGVGQAKRDDLRRYKSETDLTLMTTLKRALDPHNILNPGKVI